MQPEVRDCADLQEEIAGADVESRCMQSCSQLLLCMSWSVAFMITLPRPGAVTVEAGLPTGHKYPQHICRSYTCPVSA